MDEPNPYARPSSTTSPRVSMMWLLSKLIQLSAILIRLSVTLFAAYLAFKYPIIWIFVAYEAVMISIRLFIPLFSETRQAKALRIQQLAKNKTGADYLGSAIHTAGHPLLKVNQPVVLALKESELSIYAYDSSIPVDTLSVNELQTVAPVVFDDDYIPHVGVIDNTAQALQISFQRQNVECVCSFRRMYKIRPIEWYQAIQKARLGKNVV